MANGYDEYDPYGNNAYPDEWGTGLPEMNMDYGFGESLGAGVISGIADIGLPAMGFGLVAANEAAEMFAGNRVEGIGDWARRNPEARGLRGWLARGWATGPDDRNPGLRRGGLLDMGGIRPGWRAGQRIGRFFTGSTQSVKRLGLAGRAIRGGFGLAGAGIGLGISMLPIMAVEAGVGYLANNLMEGAEGYYHSNRMMEQVGMLNSTFGAQSILDDQSGFGSEAIRDWTLAGGIESISNTAQISNLGREGITDLAGVMTSQGMLGSFGSPEEFMTKFRSKLQQVQKLSQTLDVSIGEAVQVMSTMNRAGISSEAQVNLGQYAGTISAMTGQSFGAVMGQGLAGASLAAQMGISPDQGAGLAMANLSTMATLEGLNALDPSLLARVGGAENLADRLTQHSLQMSRTYGGQRLLARLVDESGSSFDMERLGDVTAGGRPGRRRLDPYALDDLAAEFRENEAAILMGQIGRLRARYGEGSRFNRAQYQMLAELGIEDPQEQLAYLQNLRTAPMMGILEAQQQRGDAFQAMGQQAGYSNQAFLQRVGQFFEDAGETLDQYIGEPVRRFGQRFARAMEEAGEGITRFIHGSAPTDRGPLQIGQEALTDYARDIWRGDVFRSMSNADINSLRQRVGFAAEQDYRGWWGTNPLFGGASDTRLSSRIVQAVQSGQITQEQAREWGLGMWNARGLTEEGLDDLRERGLLANDTPIDLPGGGQGYLIFDSIEGRREAQRSILQQGRGARTEDVDWFRRELTEGEGNRLMDRISTAVEESGARGLYQTVGRALGYGGRMSEYTRTDRATIERITQELLPTEIRDAANISAEAMTAEEVFAWEARGISQEMLEGIAGIEELQATARERTQIPADTMMGSPIGGFAAPMGSPTGSTSPLQLSPEAFNASRRVRRLRSNIAESIQGQAGRNYLQFIAQEADVSQILGADLRGMTASSLEGGAAFWDRDEGQSAEQFSDLRQDQAISRLETVSRRREGQHAFTASDLATRWLLAGLNPTNQADLDIVSQFANNGGYREALAEFEAIGEREGGRPTSWGRVVRRRRNFLRSRGGVTLELDRALSGGVGDQASLLSEVLQATEATEISAARSRLLQEQMSGIRARMSDRIGALVDEEGESAVDMTDANYLLAVMGGESVSGVGEANMGTMSSMLRAHEIGLRAQLTRQMREDLELGEDEELGAAYQTQINQQVQRSVADLEREMQANTNRDLTFEGGITVAATRMARRNPGEQQLLNVAEQELVRELGGAQGAFLIQLGELVDEGGSQREIENLLSAQPFGQSAMNALLEEFTVSGSKEGAGGLAELAGLLAGGGEGAEDIFSTIVGRAFGAGLLSTDLQEDKRREDREVRSLRSLEAIMGSTQQLAEATREGSGGRYLATRPNQGSGSGTE